MTKKGQPLADICPNCQKHTCILDDEGIYCQSCDMLLVKLSEKERTVLADYSAGVYQSLLATKKQEHGEWTAAIHRDEKKAPKKKDEE